MFLGGGKIELKRKNDLKEERLIKPDERRSNFIEVPAMMKPIPVPKVKAEKK